MSKSQNEKIVFLCEMPREIDNKMQSIAKYISIAIKELYSMFLKYKQTQYRAQSMHSQCARKMNMRWIIKISK